MKRSNLLVSSARAALLLPRQAGRGAIWIYRHTLSPLVGYHCRHLPTCSAYGDEAIDRLLRWLDTGRMAVVGGEPIALAGHSICVHGDSAGAVDMARAIRERLHAQGVAVAPFLA